MPPIAGQLAGRGRSGRSLKERVQSFLPKLAFSRI